MVFSRPGKSYDFVIGAVWNFWDTMRTDKNGLPYYMNHQVWRPDLNDRRGIGGDQFAMALSSWNLYYGYSGNEAAKEEMKFIADYYLTHSLSPADAAWPNLPYPYNTLILFRNLRWRHGDRSRFYPARQNRVVCL